MIPRPSAICFFFELFEEELVLFDVAVGRDEETGRDGVGKMELKDLERGKGVYCEKYLCDGEKTLRILRNSYCKGFQTE